MTDAIRNATRTFTLAALAVAMLGAIVVTAGQPAPPAQAQELPPIGDNRDLSIELIAQHTGDISYWAAVGNESPITMRNIQVRLTADPPLELEATRHRLGASPDEFDPDTNIWTIPELAALESSRLDFRPLPGSTAQYVTVQAEIISSEPAEGAANLANNQSNMEWVYVAAATTPGDKRKKLVHNAGLSVNVDDSNPEPGQNPVFKVSIVDLGQGTRSPSGLIRRTWW